MIGLANGIYAQLNGVAGKSPRAGPFALGNMMGIVVILYAILLFPSPLIPHHPDILIIRLHSPSTPHP